MTSDTADQKKTPISGPGESAGARETLTESTVLLEGEQRPAALCHLAAAIPLWGLAAAILIEFVYRERSRRVVFHARQALQFQVGMLAAAGVKLLIDLAARLVAILTGVRPIEYRADQAGWVVLAVIYALCAGVCLRGFWRALRGRVTIYPFIRRRLMQSGNRTGSSDAPTGL